MFNMFRQIQEALNVENKSVNQWAMKENFRFRYGRTMSTLKTISTRLVGKHERYCFLMDVAEVLTPDKFQNFVAWNWDIITGFNSMERVKIFQTAEQRFPLGMYEVLEMLDEIAERYSNIY